MGGEQAASVLAQVKEEQLERAGKAITPEQRERIRAPILAKYEEEGSPYYSTARLWDDGIIPPEETRTVLALGISAALNAEIPEPRFGVFRM
jgi:acetyl-CoA carboxylase carboxyltransferase component